MAALARPVRTLASSLRKSSTAFSMRVLAVANASLVLEIVVICVSSMKCVPWNNVISYQLSVISFKQNQNRTAGGTDYRTYNLKLVLPKQKIKPDSRSSKLSVLSHQ